MGRRGRIMIMIWMVEVMISFARDFAMLDLHYRQLCECVRRGCCQLSGQNSTTMLQPCQLM